MGPSDSHVLEEPLLFMLTYCLCPSSSTSETTPFCAISSGSTLCNDGALHPSSQAEVHLPLSLWVRQQVCHSEQGRGDHQIRVPLGERAVTPPYYVDTSASCSLYCSPSPHLSSPHTTSFPIPRVKTSRKPTAVSPLSPLLHPGLRQGPKEVTGLYTLKCTTTFLNDSS